MENYLLKNLNISSSVLENGKKYFQEGKVHLQKEENGEYFATVIGKEVYKTSVTVKGNRIVSFSCSCLARGCCKHVVALSYLILRKDEESPYSSFKKEMRQLSFKNDLNGYRGLPYKIRFSKSDISDDDYFSLIAEYLIGIVKNDVFFDECNLISELHVFERRVPFKEEEIKLILSKGLVLVSNDFASKSAFLASFLKDSYTSEIAQSFIVSHIDDEEYSLQSFLTSLSGKELPSFLIPSFTSLLIKYCPRVLTTKDLLFAKEEYENDGNFDELICLLRLLLKKSDPSLFLDKDFEYLSRNGFISEARSIAFSLLKLSDDFSSYIRYRKLFTDKEFYNVRYQVENAIMYKKYLNSALLIDGKNVFPSLYESFSLINLKPYEIFISRMLIKDSSTIHILVEKSHQYIKGELGKKNRNKDYFYSLLFLDYLKDDSISFCLFDKNLLNDKEDKKYKGIWLYLISKNNMLAQTSYLPYLEDKHVSN